MYTQWNSKRLHFQGVGTRKVEADFDGGTITSDAGALLLRKINVANHFFDDFASCLVDLREQWYVEHSGSSDFSDRQEQRQRAERPDHPLFFWSLHCEKSFLLSRSV